MSVMTMPQSQSLLPPRRPLTRADLEAMPDDGHRYELIDGALIVTPSPTWMHQRSALNLAGCLREACSEGFEVFMAALDVVLAEDTVMQPDILVARQKDLGKRDLPAVPVLAVEVLSPSTKHIDRGLKLLRLEEAGCPSYWIVDPQKPALTVWELRDGAYVLVAEVTGDDEFRAERPFPVVVRPSALVTAYRPTGR